MGVYSTLEEVIDKMSKVNPLNTLNKQKLVSAVKGKVVLITGASSGIGKSVAFKLSEAGAKTILVARTQEKLETIQREINNQGGDAYIYSADLSDLNSCEELVKRVLSDFDMVDILINNAGRSIRRSIHISYDRFHDYERCMQINYFGALKLILGFLPKMTENFGGQIINISSIGTLMHPPRFSAYIASKSALEAFSRTAQAEYLDRNVCFTVINMPLVRTDMISATSIYDHIPTLTPEGAADLICYAIAERKKRVATKMGAFQHVLNAVMPKSGDIIRNAAYQLFPDSKSARGLDKDEEDKPTPMAVIFARVMRGIHW